MTRWIPVLLLAIAVGGCGYALSGKGNTLPQYIRRIGVPAFQNRSTTPELDRLITDAIRVEFQSKGKFIVVPDSTGVDAVLSGSIQSVTHVATAFNDQTRQATKYLVTVRASAEFKETKDNKIFWTSSSLQVTDEYDLGSGAAANDLAALFSQDRNALDRLAKAFARSLVQSILEAF